MDAEGIEKLFQDMSLSMDGVSFRSLSPPSGPSALPGALKAGSSSGSSHSLT